LLDHLAGLFGLADDQGADGVEAVEEKVGCELLAELEELGFFGEAFGIVAALAVLLLFFRGIPKDAKDAHTTDLEKSEVEANGPGPCEKLGIVDGIAGGMK
jgi:hypothetical protein